MDSIYNYIDKNLSEKRKVHTFAVRDEAIKLSKLYGANIEKATTAALFHDIFRGINTPALNIYVKRLGLDKKYLDNPNLAHGKLASIIMRRDFGIEDEDILNAVSYHTTGRSDMSLLEKIIYISDAIEPNREYPGVQELRKAAYEDIDKACLMSLKNTKKFVEDRGLYLDEDTLKAIDWLEN